MPLISVIIPALNAEATLGETLQSLAAQSFRDFEVILVDDGSSDGTAEVAARFETQFPLRRLRHESPQGVAQSLNDGLQAADSELVARLDADDLAHPERLRLQVEHLRQRPEVHVCGTQLVVFDHDLGLQQPLGLLSHPAADPAIRTALIQRCAIAHPSVLARRSLFEWVGRYDPVHDFAEDYELWCRASLAGAVFSNLEMPLTYYRKHARQVGQQRAQQQWSRDLAIKHRYMRSFLRGQDPGRLPEFLALQTRFVDVGQALLAYQDCAAAMIELAARVPDVKEYTAFARAAIARHLQWG